MKENVPFRTQDDMVMEKMEVLKAASPEKYVDPVTGEIDEARLRADAIVVVREAAKPAER